MHKIFPFLLALLTLFSGSQAFALATGYSSAVTPTPTGFGIKFASNGTPTATMAQAGTGVTVASQSIGLPLTNTVAPIALAASAIIGGAQIGGPWGAAGGGLLWTVPQLGKSSTALSIIGLNFIVFVLYDQGVFHLPCVLNLAPALVCFVGNRHTGRYLGCQLLQRRLRP